MVTNNVHYIEQDHSYLHEVQLCLAMNETLDDEYRFRYPSDQFYLKDSATMYALFEGDEIALANSQRIAERCDFNFEFKWLDGEAIWVRGVEWVQLDP